MYNERGVLYITWGKPYQNAYGVNYDDLLNKSIKSVEEQKLPYKVLHVEDHLSRGLLNKCSMYDLTPFRNTLFLDADTIVLDDISFGFKQSALHGIAITQDEACLLSRWGGLQVRGEGNWPEYNTGVIFFNKDYNKVKPIFNRWSSLCNDMNIVSYLQHNDQPIFSISIIENKFNPYVLPPTWNFRRYNDNDSVFGPIKIWHTTKELTPKIREQITRKESGFYNVI